MFMGDNQRQMHIDELIGSVCFPRSSDAFQTLREKQRLHMKGSDGLTVRAAG